VVPSANYLFLFSLFILLGFVERFVVLTDTENKTFQFNKSASN